MSSYDLYNERTLREVFPHTDTRLHDVLCRIVHREEGSGFNGNFSWVSAPVKCSLGDELVEEVAGVVNCMFNLVGKPG